MALGLTFLMLVLMQLAAVAERLVFDEASARGVALAKIGGALLVEVVVIALALAIFRAWHIPAFENPLKEPGRFRGWLLAAAIWCLTVLPILLDPAPGVPVYEASLFNLVGSLLAGPGAGVAEELIFRGLIVSLLVIGGWARTGQVLLSSLLFGLAHAGWGLLSGRVATSLMAMTGTALLGVVLAVVYLFSGRRLLPAMLLHAAMNVVIEPWLVMGVMNPSR